MGSINDFVEVRLRMMGTFNQHLPMILSDNYWFQSKSTSLLKACMGVIPPFVQ